MRAHHGLLFDSGGAPPPTGSAWNPADAAAGWAFTSADTVATRDATGNRASVRGTTFKSASAPYFEIVVDTDDTAGQMFIGVADPGVPLSSSLFPPIGGTAYAVYYNAGQFISDGGLGSSVANLGHGDVVGIGLNFSSHMATFWKNGVSQGAVAFAAGFDMYPFVLGRVGYAHVATLRTVIASPPSGFTSWD